VTTYGQFCPIALTCEVLTERWTPLVVRELLSGSTRFNELRRGVPLMSPSLLSKRLKTLERVGVIERRPGRGGQAVEYALTPAGEELRPIIESMGTWGQRWARDDVKAEHLDASYLMWNVRRRVEVDEFPQPRVVVHFHLRGSIDKKSRFWLVLEPGATDLCLTDPGFEPDVFVDCHIRTMVDFWMGRTEFAAAIRSGDITLEGPAPLTRRLPTWFLRSELADVDRP
jgi:DNA-binding HxlR family transcriptional regulator